MSRNNWTYLVPFYIAGDAELVDKFTRRLVKVTKQHSQECKDLLKLMGVPYIDVSEWYFKNLLHNYL